MVLKESIISDPNSFFADPMWFRIPASPKEDHSTLSLKRRKTNFSMQWYRVRRDNLYKKKEPTYINFTKNVSPA
jgi:hypothetical protein